MLSPAARNLSRDPRPLGIKRCPWASLRTAEMSNIFLATCTPWYFAAFCVYTTSTLVNTYSDIKYFILLLSTGYFKFIGLPIYSQRLPQHDWLTCHALNIGHSMTQVGFLSYPCKLIWNKPCTKMCYYLKCLIPGDIRSRFKFSLSFSRKQNAFRFSLG